MSHDRFVRVFRPLDVAEVAIVHALLDDTDFHFYIENENFAHTHGLRTGSPSEIWVMVLREDAEVVKAILEERLG